MNDPSYFSSDAYFGKGKSKGKGKNKGKFNSGKSFGKSFGKGRGSFFGKGPGKGKGKAKGGFKGKGKGQAGRSLNLGCSSCGSPNHNGDSCPWGSPSATNPVGLAVAQPAGPAANSLRQLADLTGIPRAPAPSTTPAASSPRPRRPLSFAGLVFMTMVSSIMGATTAARDEEAAASPSVFRSVSNLMFPI